MFNQAGMTDNKPQRVYLITYSNLDGQTIPTRESFGQVCAKAFGAKSVVLCVLQRGAPKWSAPLTCRNETEPISELASCQEVHREKKVLK